MSLYVIVPLLYLASVTVPLGVVDARTARLPNALVVPGLVLTVWAVVGLGMSDPPAVLAPLCAAMGSLVVFGAGWAVGGVGMGDVKLGLLLAWLAVATDARILFPAVVITVVLATAAVMTRVAAGEGTVRCLRVPLGPALLAGFWAAVAGVALPL